MFTKENPEDHLDAIYMGTVNEKKVFGESAILEGGVRTANVLCCSDTTLLEIKRAPFKQFLLNYASKAQPLLRYLINQLIDKLDHTNNELTLARNTLYEIQRQEVEQAQFEVQLDTP
ncbi:hypothetical protein BOW51_10505 [Solemya velesiana gill symbiont]|uniref:Cyclic nucleotide-binding domain-containing protein n=2 Tax=Solemya velesiana gill symbiont TaxID=1918948 RepID=A0A1T2KS89_9GAMM|nr:hypothetical protein BOW51_10505 [Solemya velesiana gill symbiont]